MAIENEDGGSEGNVVEPNAPVVELTEVEQRALAQGWVPKDQYEGTKKWRDAEDFLDRGELFSKIDEQKRRLNSQDNTIEELKKHYKAVRETEYKRALNALKAEKKEALDQGDTARVVELDDEIADKRVEQAQLEQIAARQPVQVQPPNPQVVAWVNRNPWYNTDKAMKIFADTVADEIVYSGETNPTKVLEETERRVKKEFAHKFTNPNRAKAGTVEGGGSRGGSTKETFELNDEETQVMNKLVRAKVMTKEEYIADIKAERESRGA